MTEVEKLEHYFLEKMWNNQNSETLLVKSIK